MKIIQALIIIIMVSNITTLNVSSSEKCQQNEVLDNIDIGDILIMEYKSNLNPLQNNGGPNDHIAIYIGEDQFVHAKPFSKVEIKDYEYFKENYVLTQFGYIKNATLTEKENAANWAKDQVGSRYQNIKKISPKGKNNRWYNSELIWKAYMIQGIDIDADLDENHKIVEVSEISIHPNVETYNNYEVPDFLRKGDIIMMDIYTDGVWGIEGNSNDHSGLYMGKDFRDGQYFVQAGSGGVQYIKFDTYKTVFENFTYYTVNNASQQQKNSAVQWAVEHIDCKYQFFFPESIYPGMWELGLKCDDPENPEVKTSDRFYCMELVWASYYNQGIDLDSNGWQKLYPKAPPMLGVFAKLWDRVEGILFEPFAYVNGDDIKFCENTTEYII